MKDAGYGTLPSVWQFTVGSQTVKKSAGVAQFYQLAEIAQTSQREALYII